MELLDGKYWSNAILDEIKSELADIKGKISPDIGLAVIVVGDDPASKVYVKNKISACEKVGITSKLYTFPTEYTQTELISLIQKLNKDSNTAGILVQLPLPKQISEKAILETISPQKDVDGFSPYQVGLLSIGEKSLVPCTPKGIMVLLKKYNIPICGAHAVVIGRSNIVGKPISNLLIQENATVTICHTKTRNLTDITLTADIIIVATGKPKLLTADMVKDGSIVVDVGINRINGKLQGDVDFEAVKDKCSYITPVPGGVGPMTIAMLMSNTLEAYKRQNGIS
ncbi:MAG: bifunctional methylenetetrahydrofolate dehydrogenase/methenyltetrahydrofolate cyclohydrolase FolD [Christensenellaceae bacterium]|jgi:methylenetetrahydrofolate dehydrogenase (NADP+)/methenyltetrahydrofolate cyclohydrolase|nr:bifunctional methylenetetrahydrofolate dehydrogenase/methenyltetrahydrofolate cyclohydrolase FolD [Christensenellaceae bacterium]